MVIHSFPILLLTTNQEARYLLPKMKAVPLEMLNERKSASPEWPGLFRGNLDLIQAVGCCSWQQRALTDTFIF